MRKRPSLAMILASFLVATTPFVANATGLDTTPTSTTGSDAVDMEYVLSELTRQHDNASTLVKSARQPQSLLSLDSSLLSSESPIDTDSLLVSQQGEEDVLQRLTAVASNSVTRFSQSGMASWYGERFHGRTTASGERFNMNAMTAAHPSLPFNSYLRVTNQDNGESVVVKVNDRGPFNSNRVLDLSFAAAEEIGLVDDGVGNVTIERVSAP